MQCPKCGVANPDGKKFCTSCGGSLQLRCPACNGENTPEAKFCGDCGASLTTAASASVKQPSDTAALPVPEAERRQLTVMFCDLVGSTALAERLDPEELRELLARYQDTCAEVIQRYEGYIARYVGDGLLVYFGYPQAHEDDALRAVRAGLVIVDGIQDLQTKIATTQVNLAVRIGITTGLVVVGDIGSGERREEKAIVGETPNLAARLQALAEPNTIVIGASTRRLVEGLFDYDDLGPQRLKGMSGTVTAYRVRGESGAPSRFEAVAQKGLTPLVGREEEIGLLLQRWEQAKEGGGQVVLLSAEAGSGKSRIVRVFRERLGEAPHSRVLYYCSPYHQHTAFYPVIEQLERALRLEKTDAPEQKLDKLDAVLGNLDLPVTDFGPVLASLLSLSASERYPPLALSPDDRKRRTLEALAAMIEAMTMRQPVLMVVEDAQWIDPSTLELMSLLVDQLRAKRFLMLVAFRPEFAQPWGGYAQVTALMLNRLSQKQCAAMVMKVTGGKALPPEVLEQIVAKTDGVPLFVEELTKNLLEAGLFKEQDGALVLNGPLPAFAIPASLQDSLMARLDRLIADVKKVAQLAATLGRIFSYELLAAVARVKEGVLSDALAQLVTSGLIYRHGLAPAIAYEFKHALVQDAAYQSLLKSTRQQYHQRIAGVLEERFPQIVETQPELLAHHYTEAQLPEQAIGYWQRAAVQAGERAGYVEALADLAKALDLIKTLPDTLERTKQELAVYLRQAEALHFLGRREEIVDLLLPHQERLDRLEDHSLAGQYYFWLGYAHSWLGNREEATRNLERSLEEATRSRDKAIMGLAHRALGLEYRYSGQLDNAVSHARRGMELLGQTKHWFWLGDAAYTLAFNYYWIGQFDLALQVATRLDAIGKTIGSRRFQTLGTMMTGVTLATSGECEAGIEACRRALELAPDPFETAVVLACLGKAYLEKREVAQAVPVLEEAVKLGDQVRSKQWRAWFRTLLGEAYFLARRMVEAQEQIEKALEISLSSKFPLGTGCSRRVLGWIAQATGELDEAQRQLDEAIQVFRLLGAKFELARTCLARAELSNAQGDSERVSACLREAHRLFRDLHVPRYMETTQELARRLSAVISEESVP
jgi:class 3 adenylate cyclase/tetratricopeptide (TPR) repeat protein